MFGLSKAERLKKYFENAMDYVKDEGVFLLGELTSEEKFILVSGCYERNHTPMKCAEYLMAHAIKFQDEREATSMLTSPGDPDAEAPVQAEENFLIYMGEGLRHGGAFLGITDMLKASELAPRLRYAYGDLYNEMCAGHFEAGLSPFRMGCTVAALTEASGKDGADIHPTDLLATLKAWKARAETWEPAGSTLPEDEAAEIAASWYRVGGTWATDGRDHQGRGEGEGSQEVLHG